MNSFELDAEVNCKLTDFGTSRGVNCVTDTASGYTTGVGTPIYMAPEMLKKNKYDEKADVFSFGVMAYNVLTGKEPYAEFETVWGKNILFVFLLPTIHRNLRFRSGRKAIATGRVNKTTTNTYF